MPGRKVSLNDDSLIMAFDFGTTKIGIAVGQNITGTATPLGNVRAKDGKPDWPHLDTIVKEWRPHLLVIGMPLNLDGSDSEMSSRAKKFANRLEARFNLPTVTFDERLSSFDAREVRKESEAKNRAAKVGSKKETIDSLAAKLILESWLRNPTL